jgi:hypothetical protein
MTEAQWLASESPREMLAFLRRHRLAAPGVRRRLRLFACACCRSFWDQFDDERCRRAVEVSERYADGRARRAELGAAREGAKAAWRVADEKDALAHQWQFPEAERWEALVRSKVASAALHCAQQVMTVTPAAQTAHAAQVVGAAARAHAALVRDLFGNPFRPAPAIDPAWLSWNGGTVCQLAQAIYEERAFDRLPVLADALEDTGCTDQHILAHCRSGGEHVRGCWVIDLLLGKQ